MKVYEHITQDLISLVNTPVQDRKISDEGLIELPTPFFWRVEPSNLDNYMSLSLISASVVKKPFRKAATVEIVVRRTVLYKHQSASIEGIRDECNNMLTKIKYELDSAPLAGDYI